MLFVNVDEFEDVIEKSAGDSDQQLVDNLKLVSGLGISSWVDGGVSHAVIRLGTN